MNPLFPFQHCKSFAILILFWIGYTLLSMQAFAQNFNFGSASVANLGKISEDTFLATLNFKLEKGWKIYWHSGGYGALPPSIEWDLTSQAAIVNSQILWAYPEKLNILGLKTLGYTKNISLPVEIILSPKPVTQLTGTLHYPICKKVCIPATLNFTLYPETSAKITSKTLSKIMRKIPDQLSDNTNKLGELFWHQNPENNQIILNGQLNSQWKKVIFSAQKKYILPKIHKKTGRLQQNTHVPFAANAGETLQILVTAKTKENFITTTLYAQPAPVSPIKSNVTGNVTNNVANNPIGEITISLFFLALFAGLLLNFMPCVLPVLSLKILPTSQNHRENHNAKSDLRINCLFAGIGILIGFGLLASFLIFIRQFGFAHWGLQFQSPFFLIFMLWTLLFFIATILNWHFLILPTLPLHLSQRFGLKTMIPKPAKAMLQKMMIGIIVVWFASACTAPIIGTIILTALTAQPWVLFGMLELLGLGMASPYFLIAASPYIASYIPKSGRWNQWLSKFIVIALLLTCLWLLLLLKSHLALWQLMGLCFSIAFLFMLIRLKNHSRFRKNQRLFLQKAPLFSICLLTMLTWLYLPNLLNLQNINPSPTNSPSIIDKSAESFMPDAVSALLQDGKNVIIDITALWCISCQINQARIWQSSFGKNLIAQENIIFMRGDWTLPNINIEKFLQKYNHYAIPFTIIFTPTQPEGFILPALFSISDIKAHLPLFLPSQQ